MPAKNVLLRPLHKEFPFSCSAHKDLRAALWSAYTVCHGVDAVPWKAKHRNNRQQSETKYNSKLLFLN